MQEDESISIISTPKSTNAHIHTHWEDVSSEDSSFDESMDGGLESKVASSEEEQCSIEETDSSEYDSNQEPTADSIETTESLPSHRQGRGRGRGRGQGRGRGRGRGRGCGRGRRRGNGTGQIVSESLPSLAVDIATAEQNIPLPPPFNPTRTPGPHLPPDIEISAIGLFELFFNEEITQHLVDATIAYANAHKEKKPAMYKRFCFQELTRDEVMCFVCVLLLLGITGVRSYRHAWSMKNAQFIVRLNELMTCNRFEAISSFFHVVIPEEELQNSSHPLKKILPLRNHMKSKSKELYQPLQQVSIDGRMVKSKARTKFRQYMKDKPAKWGFKYWVASDPSAYTYDFNLYLGAAQSDRSEHGLAYDVVTTLVATLHHQNYQLYCDNFYSSPALFSHLLTLGITATGTVRIKGDTSCRGRAEEFPEQAFYIKGERLLHSRKGVSHCLHLLE